MCSLGCIRSVSSTGYHVEEGVASGDGFIVLLLLLLALLLLAVVVSSSVIAGLPFGFFSDVGGIVSLSAVVAALDAGAHTVLP